MKKIDNLTQTKRERIENSLLCSPSFFLQNKKKTTTTTKKLKP